MKFAIVIYPDAEHELQELAIYLDRQSSGMGIRLLDEYEETLKFLEQFAEAIPKRDERFRHVMIGKFPIVMVYLVDHRTVRIRKVVWASRQEERKYRR